MSLQTQRRTKTTAQTAFPKNGKGDSPPSAQSAPIAETAPETIEIQLAGWTITIDNDGDAERIAEHEWKVGTFAGVRRIYKEHPIPQLLTGFLLGVDPTVFVDQKRDYTYNFQKQNLFIYRPKETTN
jgi:hypothetical protein